MVFEQIPVGQMQNFCYLVGDEGSKEAAVVDPGWEVEKILNIAKKHDLDIKYILITHSHYDHIDGVKEINEKTGAIVYVHEEDFLAVEKLNIENIKKIKDDDIIDIGKLKIKVLHTPGHSPGSVCYLIENKLITGDMLFVEGMGRIDLPGANKENMFNSLQKLKKLDDTIEIYPGHDYGSKISSTIGYEKKNNTYMKISKEEIMGIG